MNQIFEYLIRPYQDLNILEVILEIFAVILGLTSVWFAKKDKVLVYPTGMLSTSIFVYLLFKAGLLGDMLINAYSFIVSIYGWYFWSKKKDGQILNPILKTWPKYSEKNAREIKEYDSMINKTFFLANEFEKKHSKPSWFENIVIQ